MKLSKFFEKEFEMIKYSQKLSFQHNNLREMIKYSLKLSFHSVFLFEMINSDSKEKTIRLTQVNPNPMRISHPHN